MFPTRALGEPRNPDCTRAENARFSAFARDLVLRGLSPITRACYTSDWWTLSHAVRRETGRPFRLDAYRAAAFRGQRDRLLAGGSSPATLNRRLAFLRRYAAFSAQREPLLAGLAAALAAVPYLRMAPSRRRALTAAEETRVRAAADALGPVAAAVVALLLGTGLRAAELAAVDAGDLVGPRGAPTAIRVRGGRPKTAVLGPWARPRVAAVAAALPRGDGPLLVGPSGRRLSGAGLAALVAAAAGRAGVSATPRTLRHTFAVRFVADHPGDDEALHAVLGPVGPAAVRAYRAVPPAGDALRLLRPDAAAGAPRGVRRGTVTAGGLRAEREVLAPGARLAVQAASVDCLVIVLSGRPVLTSPGIRVGARAGDVVLVPAGTPCRVAAAGGGAAVLRVTAERAGGRAGRVTRSSGGSSAAAGRRRSTPSSGAGSRRP